MKKTLYRLMMLVVVLTLAVTACTSQQTATPDTSPATPVSPNDTVAEGHLRPEHAANLSFLSSGVVEEVSVKIGDQVKKGDVLARLSNASQAEGQIAAAQLELITAQQALDTLNRTGDGNLAATWTAYMNAQIARAEAEREWEDLDLDSIDDEIADAETEIQDREQDLKDAQEEFDKYKNLDEDNATRKDAEDELEAAQEDYNEAVRKLEEITRQRDTVKAAFDSARAAEAEARHQYEISSQGANADELALAQARLENAQAQLTAAEASLSSFVLMAPFDAVVQEVAVRVGDQVSPEVRAVAVADPGSWIVETTDITELEVVNLEPGQKVSFTADALPGVTMEGVVSEISQSSYTQSGDVLYTVRIKADNVDPRVKWGMTVEVIFEPVD